MSTTTPLVFISYRRDDSDWATGHLFERLQSVLGQGAVLHDVDNIQPGQDFREWIDESLSHSMVVLVVIGPRWLDARDANGHRRLEQTDDWVRIEIESALKRHLKVIPVLLYPATIPSPTELPATLEKLPYLQAITIYPGEDFSLGFKRLVDAIIPAVPEDHRSDVRRQLALSMDRPRTSWTTPWRRMVLLTSIVLAVCLGLGIYFMGSPDDDRSPLQARDALAEEFASAVNDWFRIRFRTLKEAATRPALRSNEDDGHRPELMTLAKLREFSGGVYTLNERGIILAQATPNYPDMDDLRGMNFSHREYFVECRRRNAPVTTNSFQSANRNELIIVLAAPRHGQDGAFIGIVDAVVDVGTSPLSSIAQRLTATSDVHLYLIDANGIVLASSETRAIAKPLSDLGLLERFRNRTFDAKDEWKAKVVGVPETPYFVIGRAATTL